MKITSNASGDRRNKVGKLSVARFLNPYLDMVISY